MKKPRPIKHIGRKRRAAGWTLLVLGVLVAGVWAWSGWWYAWWSPPGHWRFEVGTGRVFVSRDESPRADSSWIVSTQPRGEWLWERPGHLKTIKYGGTEFWASPLWPVPLLLWPPALLLLRSGFVARRRAINNACARCGYSLAGLAKEAACPECGRGGA